MHCKIKIIKKEMPSYKKKIQMVKYLFKRQLKVI